MMRTSLAIAVCITHFSGFNSEEAQAQPEPNHRSHMVAVSPLLLMLYPNFRYWGFIDTSIALGFGLHAPWESFRSGALTGYGITLEPRFYFDRTQSLEWYLASSFSFGFVRHEDTTNAPFKLMATVGVDLYTDSDKHLTLGFAVSGGYIWNVTPIYAFEGWNFNSDVYTTNGFIFPVDGDGFIPGARFDVGWSW